MIGRIKHEKRKLKYVASINDETLSEETSPDFELQYVDIGNVDSAGGIQGASSYRFQEAPSRARRIVRDGDVIVSTVRTYLQAIAAIRSPTPNLIVSTGFAVVRPRRNVLAPGFCKYTLREPGFLAEVAMRSVGVSYPAINASELGDIFIFLPRISEQNEISEYLDKETARIDQLIGAKERLVKLLTAKRAELITQAVTRGLDRRGPLRDSRLAWIGQIPAHWALERLKFHLFGIEQGWSPQCDNNPAGEGEWGVLKAGCVNGWQFDPAENKRLPEELEPLPEYEVRAGDLLMSRANTTELLGSAALVRTVRPRLMICDKLYRLRVNEARLEKEFLVAFLRSSAGRFEFERDATGTSKSMQNIGQDSVSNVWLPIPPVSEQRDIVAHIRSETGKLDSALAATERSVGLLKERRVALIARVIAGRLVETQS